MSVQDSNTHDLLVRGMAAAKAGEVEEAHFYLNWLLRLEPAITERIDALYWLSQTCTDKGEKRGYLENILSYDPGEPRARRLLAILDGRLNPAEIVDPDRLTQPEENGPVKSKADRFTCPNCGGRMTYTPDGQSLSCDFCETRQHLHQGGNENQEVGQSDFLVAMATAGGHLKPALVHTFKCQGCGSVFMLAPEQLSVTCPYCQSSYVLQQAEMRELVLPDGLVAFDIDRAQAEQNLANWMRTKEKRQTEISYSLQALFLPVWSFYIDGDIYWRCEKAVSSAFMETWVEEKGIEPVLLDNILIPASNRLGAAFKQVLLHCDPSEAGPYDERFLAGVAAESFQVPVADASLDARQSILGGVRRSISQGLSGQTRDLTLNTGSVRVESFKLILFPVWLASWEHDRQRQEVLIDGQSGKVYPTQHYLKMR